MLGILAALLTAVPAFGDPSISSKRAQAQQVLGEMNQLDASLERAVEQYNYANVKLARVQRDLKQNGRELHVAKHNLGKSRGAIARRLVTLYTSDQTSTVEVILGAQSLDDAINRVDDAKNVTSLDAQVLRQVKTFKTAVKHQRHLLAVQRSEAQRLVAERAAQRRSIESKLSERRQLLASIKGEIAHLEAAQRARSLQMARVAQQRLKAQNQEQQQASQEPQAAQDTVVGATAATPEGATVAPPSSYSGAVGAAMAQLGKPYVWAAAGPDSFDCSGLIMYAFAQVGKSLPHSTYALYAMGVPVSKDQLQPGDLVFFDGLGHAGIYIGGGQFVHAPHTGDVVKVSSLSEGWYTSAYVGARRIL